MKRKLAALALLPALTLGLAACSGESVTPETETTSTEEVTVEETLEEAVEPASVLTEDEALEALASISSEATSQQWRSIAKAVCEEYEAQTKPLDELGETSASVAAHIAASPMFEGTGDTPASFPGSEVQPGQMGMLLLGSTELSCPKWTPDASAYAETVLADAK